MFVNRTALTPDLEPEHIVAQAWRQVLNARSLQDDEPFDQAGGDSLRMLRLIFLIEEATGLNLPMEACHVGLRPSGFVSVLELARRINESGAAEPPGAVFLIPGLDGETPLEAGFRAACAPELRMVTVDLPDWPETIGPGYSMHDLIERTTAEIMTRAPTGPLRLVGYSFGGLIALGATKLLMARGREVRFFGILDSSALPRPPWMPRRSGTFPLRALRATYWEAHGFIAARRERRMVQHLSRRIAHFVTSPGRSRWLGLMARLRKYRLRTVLAIHTDLEVRAFRYAGFARTWLADASHGKQKLTVPVVLFRAQDDRPDVPADLGWSALCRQVHMVHVSGGHIDMMLPPHLDDLRTRFIEAVRQADDPVTQTARELT